MERGTIPIWTLRRENGLFQPSNQSFNKKQQFSPAKPPTNRKIITHLQSPNKTTNAKTIDQNMLLQSSGNRTANQNLKQSQKGASNPNLYNNSNKGTSNEHKTANKITTATIPATDAAANTTQLVSPPSLLLHNNKGVLLLSILSLPLWSTCCSLLKFFCYLATS